jgi:hypothetical protein
MLHHIKPTLVEVILDIDWPLVTESIILSSCGEIIYGVDANKNSHIFCAIET